MKFDRKLYLCDDEGKRFFGLGPLHLLKLTGKTGSLHKAADSMGLSYHKALDIIRNAEKGFGCALLSKKIGGQGGGGSILTDEAHIIIERFISFQKKSDEALGKAFDEHFRDL